MSSTPQFCLPLVLPESTITLEYDSAAAEVITVAAQTVYAHMHAGGILDVVLDAISAATALDWDINEASGLPHGRTLLEMNDSTDFVTAVTFSSATLAAALGFSTTTPDVVVTGSGPYLSEIISPYVRSHQWTPHSRTVAPLDENDWRRVHTVIEESAPGFGARTVDIYHSYREGVVRVASVWAASARRHYRQQAEYAGKIGEAALAADPWLDWESFAYAWLTSATTTARFFPDRTVNSYETVQAATGQLQDADRVLLRASSSPLSYNLALRVLGE